MTAIIKHLIGLFQVSRGLHFDPSFRVQEAAGDHQRPAGHVRMRRGSSSGTKADTI